MLYSCIHIATVGVKGLSPIGHSVCLSSVCPSLIRQQDFFSSEDHFHFIGDSYQILQKWPNMNIYYETSLGITIDITVGRHRLLHDWSLTLLDSYYSYSWLDRVDQPLTVLRPQPTRRTSWKLVASCQPGLATRVSN